MIDKRFAGLAIKSEISIGNLFTFVTMVALILMSYADIKNRVNNNTVAIKSGILPEAELRIAALETRYGIEIMALRDELSEIKNELKQLRRLLNRTPPD